MSIAEIMNKKVAQMLDEVKSYGVKNPNEIIISLNEEKLNIVCPKMRKWENLLFVLLFLFPSIAFLEEYSNTTLFISILWLIIMSSTYYRFTKSEVECNFYLNEKKLIHKNINWLHHYLRKDITIPFNQLNEIELKQVYISKYSGPNTQVRYNNEVFGWLIITDLTDSFISKRLKFILTKLIS